MEEEEEEEEEEEDGIVQKSDHTISAENLSRNSFKICQSLFLKVVSFLVLTEEKALLHGKRMNKYI